MERRHEFGEMVGPVGLKPTAKSIMSCQTFSAVSGSISVYPSDPYCWALRLWVYLRQRQLSPP